MLHSAKGRFLSGVHDVLAFVALGANAFAAAWGGISYLRKIPSTLFWPILRVAQATVALEVALGVALWLGGKKPPDSLHSTVSAGNAPVIEQYLADLAECVTEVGGTRLTDRSTSYATLE